MALVSLYYKYDLIQGEEYTENSHKQIFSHNVVYFLTPTTPSLQGERRIEEKLCLSELAKVYMEEFIVAIVSTAVLTVTGFLCSALSTAVLTGFLCSALSTAVLTGSLSSPPSAPSLSSRSNPPATFLLPDVAPAASLGADLRDRRQTNQHTTADISRPTSAAAVVRIGRNLPWKPTVRPNATRTSSSNISLISSPNLSSEAPGARHNYKRDLRRIEVVEVHRIHHRATLNLHASKSGETLPNFRQKSKKI
ncbi:hypothetical protein Prudu_018459 [Prunus dulcis]|uniref:Uncharacterized protein n=1 Tax=Prunus dulcis TaxID=3755 RepID=A0A4Y1RR23_PRUDU|nr:hypothetical protein Prudu_018459 [Prunus dulcis]